MKTLYRKYKILLIALTCAVTGIIAFFTIHGVVYNIVSSKNTQNTNEKLEDKIFVFYHDNQIRVANIKENGTYIQKRYQKSDDGIAKLIATDGKKMLNYSFTYWGNIVSINSGPLQYDNNGNIIKFGADGYTLATEEELSIIQAAEERESTKCKLSDFMMTPDEYRAVYKASGMPISNNLIDLDSKDFCILYEKKDYNKKTLESILITDNGIPDKNTVRLISDSLNGKTRGYDYMMRPILLYLKNIPGALADIHEIIDRWDAVEEKPNFAGEIISIFTHNGITYYKMESSTDSRMYIEISVHKNHEIYLADYPEFLAKEKDQKNGNSGDIKQDGNAIRNDDNEFSSNENSSDNVESQTSDADSNDIERGSNIVGTDGRSNSTETPIEGNSSVSSSTGGTLNNNPCVKGHKWVAVTKKVHHDEVGHYETVQDAKKTTKYQCAVCYEHFDSLDQYYSHFDKEHSYDNNLVLAFRDRYETVDDWEYYDRQVWVVDQEAYEETVVTGYKCSVCGKIK